MLILIVEDNQNRIDFFSNFLKEHRLICTKYINEAFDILTTRDVPVIFLDYDLEENHLTSNNNGYELVKLIVSNCLQKNSIFYIHSMNPSGANAMLNLLKNNDYKVEWFPFEMFLRKDNNI